MLAPKALMVLLALCLISGLAEASRFTIFFNTRGHATLDRVLAHRAPYLSQEELRDVAGMPKADLQTLHDVMSELGGTVTKVSTLASWVEVLFSDKAAVPNFLKGSIMNALAAAGLHPQVAHIHHHKVEQKKRTTKKKKSTKERFSVSSQEQKYRSIIAPVSDDMIKNHFYPSLKEEIATNFVFNVYGPFVVYCENGEMEGPNNPCLTSLTVKGYPNYVHPTNTEDTQLIPADSPLLNRKICSEIFGGCNPDPFLYYLPLDQLFTSANVLYSGVEIEYNISGKTGVAEAFDPIIPKYFNASAASFRELYGIPDKFKGEGIVQATSLGPAYFNNCVNISAIDEYLSLLGITDHSELHLAKFVSPGEYDTDGQNNDCENNNDDGETMLDTQTLQSMAPMASTYFFPGAVKLQNFTQDDVVDLYKVYGEAILTLNPDVISYSWNAANLFVALYEDGMAPADIFPFIESEMKQLAVLGISILVASGDGGASAAHGPCFNATSGTDGGGFGGTLIANHFNNWPIWSEWVTVVGGTEIRVLEEGGEATQITGSAKYDGGVTSSGGFSGTAEVLEGYKTPSWQKTHVETYLQNNGPDTFAGFPTNDTFGYNPNGRGYPDIAAYSAYFPMLGYDGSYDPYSGTSLAAPLAASIFSLANEALVEKGYSKIGYANPMLYWMGESCLEAFTDITFGDNQANMHGEQCEHGYPAAPGWDAATGMGTIRFENFVECAMKYQDKMAAESLSAKYDGAFVE